MPLSRASTRTSTHSSTHADEDLPGTFPPTEAPRNFSTQQTLSEAVHARRAEFTRPHTVRIKVGTWNVAGKKGTEDDIAAWFVKGKGVSENLSGIENSALSQPGRADATSKPTEDRRESVEQQEARVAQQKYGKTVPKHDHGELPRGHDIGLYVLGLQEVVDVNSITENLKPYSDSSIGDKWREKIQEALPREYQLVAQQQLVGLMLFIYASPLVTSQISSVSTTSCGTGMLGRVGNKGAVTTRIVLGETTRLAFINSHLSSGVGKQELDRRNWDARTITDRTHFDPIVDSFGSTTQRRERIGDEDFAFWFGDLNYRLEGIPGEDVRRLLMLHTRNEYDTTKQKAAKVERELAQATEAINLREKHSRDRSQSTSTIASSISSPSKNSTDRPESPADTDRTSILEEDDELDPSNDPAHLQTTLGSLLSHDELHQQQKERRAFHEGWREGPITFLPTYKYDVGSVGVFDSGDKKRGPSWCDRILYRTRKDRTDYENMLLEEQDAQRKDKEFESVGMETASKDNSMLYDYDPDLDGEDEEGHTVDPTADEPVNTVTMEGYKDLIQLEHYVSHQRVLSSDHKPLDAVFRLEYDAVVPELKSNVHQEVARDLDRAENEGRPFVTLIPDNQLSGDGRVSEGLNFGDIHYDGTMSQTLTLANTGRVPAFFGFMARNQENLSEMSPTPEWLRVSVEMPQDSIERGAEKVSKTKEDHTDWAQNVPEVYSLEPGCTCTIRCTAGVHTPSLARGFNAREALEDILILRVKEGRDHFLSIRGNWQPTVLCRSIEDLVRVPDGGIRKYGHKVLTTSENREGDIVVTSSAPKELFKLTQAIETLSERLVAEWSMTEASNDNAEQPPWVLHAGWPFEGWTVTNSDERQRMRATVIEALDADLKLNAVFDVDSSPLHRLEAISEVFLIFLNNLTDGVIPENSWNSIVTQFFGKDRTKTGTRDDDRATILEILAKSSPHSVSFVLITSMLGSIVQELSNNVSPTDQKQLPSSPKVSLRRRALSNDPKVARKQMVQKAYASIFADVLIRSPETSSAKAKSAAQEQKREVIEIFLDNGLIPG